MYNSILCISQDLIMIMKSLIYRIHLRDKSWFEFSFYQNFKIIKLLTSLMPGNSTYSQVYTVEKTVLGRCKGEVNVFT